MSTLVGDPLEEPMPLGAATVYLNKFAKKSNKFDMCGTLLSQDMELFPRVYLCHKTQETGYTVHA
jgi:hypothetical protein